MKQLIVTGAKQAEFQEVSEPGCEACGVLVRARLTAISAGTELRVYRAIPVDDEGKFLHERVPFELPTENGYSMVGDVIEVGSSVTGIGVGDRVFLPAAHRQVATMDASRVTPLPSEVPDEDAVMLSILEVAHRAVRDGDPPPGGNVVIVGQGVIGLSALAYCVAFGLRTAVVDLEPARLEIAKEMGADLAVSPAVDGYQDQVLSLFDGVGADLALEAGSNWTTIRTAMELTRTDGRVVIVSRHTHQPDFNPFGQGFLGKRLSLVTTYGYPAEGSRWDQRASVGLSLDLLARGRLAIGPMLTHRFAWHELPQVYARLDQGDREIVGALLDWSEPGE